MIPQTLAPNLSRTLPQTVPQTPPHLSPEPVPTHTLYTTYIRARPVPGPPRPFQLFAHDLREKVETTALRASNAARPKLLPIGISRRRRAQCVSARQVTYSDTYGRPALTNQEWDSLIDHNPERVVVSLIMASSWAAPSSGPAPGRTPRSSLSEPMSASPGRRERLMPSSRLSSKSA